MRYAEYPPLLLLKRIETDYPGVFDLLAQIHAQNGHDDLGSWPKWCYAPLTAAFAVILGDKCFDSQISEEDIRAVSPVVNDIAFLSAWLERRKIYVLEESLEKELLTSYTALSRTTTESLTHIPSYGFYVQSNFLKDIEPNLHGFFVSLNYDQDTYIQEFRLMLLYNSGSQYVVSIPINEKSIAGAITQSLDNMLWAAKNELPGGPQQFDEEDYAALKKILEGAMKIVVYIYFSQKHSELYASSFTTLSVSNEANVLFLSKLSSPEPMYSLIFGTSQHL